MIIDRPIRGAAEYDSAIADIRQLWGAEVGTADGNRLDLLLILVSAYEDEHYAVAPPDPIEAILERMNDRGFSRSDLGELLGVQSGRVSEILNRRRPLTITMIRKLTTALGLSEHCLLQEYPLEAQREYA